MSRLDDLPPDQRATLSLLLRERKSYAAVSALLGIPERAVHDRAHAALAVLAPRQARAVPPQRRAEIGDYLLGQLPGVAERLSTRTFLGGSDTGRAWARELAGALEPLAGGALPDIPPAARGDGGARAPGEAPSRSGNGPAPVPAPASAGAAASPKATAGMPSSRVGGALLLAAIVAGVVVAVILLSGGGSSKKTSASSTGTSARSSTSTSATGPKVSQRLALRPPSSSSPAIGAVEILSEGGKRAFYLAAEHLPPSKGFSYVIWLYNSTTSFVGLSKAPTVAGNGRLVGGALLPANAGDYREMLITRETSAHPAKPGTIVLRGPFSLSG